MKRVLLNTLSLCVLSALAGSALAAPSHFEHFITRDGAALMDGKQPVRPDDSGPAAPKATGVPSAGKKRPDNPPEPDLAPQPES